MKSPNFHDIFWRLGQSWGCDERLAALLDVEVVKEGIEVVLGGKAGVQQEALDAQPLSEASIVEHLQVVLNTPSLYRQEKSIIPP